MTKFFAESIRFVGITILIVFFITFVAFFDEASLSRRYSTIVNYNASVIISTQSCM